jgi:hypothetical protein
MWIAGEGSLPLNLSCNPLLILMNVLGEAKNAAEEK